MIVEFDVATLVNPRVVEVLMIAGTMTVINPNIPGTVRKVIICPMPVKGSGVIAKLTFDSY